MSLKECNRKGCKSIICDRYSSKYGYICNSCFEELSKTDNKIEIEDFMKSHKKEDFSDFFEKINNIFKLR